MPGIGPMEIVVVLIVALLILGPKRLPEMGRSLGDGMRSFKDAVTGDDKAEQLAEGATPNAPTAAGPVIREPA
jgi:sec-independent protein translocase protein TatA